MNNIYFFDKKFEDQVKREEEIIDKVSSLKLDKEDQNNIDSLLLILRKTMEYRVKDINDLNKYYLGYMTDFFYIYKEKNKGKEDKKTLEKMEEELIEYLDHYVKVGEKNINRYKRLINRILEKGINY